MFGVSLGIRVGNSNISSGGGGVDADAQAYFDRVTTAGGTLSTTEKNAVNQLVIDLKANSLWTPMKAIYPMVGASAAACAQNLKSSSFTGTFSSGWTFASTGVTPNGTSAYMDTGLQPLTQLSANNTNISVYLRTNSTNYGADYIAFTSQFSCMYIQTRHPGNTLYAASQDEKGSDIGISNTSSLGFYQVNRSAIDNHKVFKNTSLIATKTVTSVGTLPTTNITISGRAAGDCSNRENAFASIGNSLTDTQAANFYTAVQAFQTTLSRQV